MHKKVKASLDEVFQYERLTDKKEKRSKQKRHWLPAVVMLATLGLICVLVFLELGAPANQQVAPLQEEEDIFRLKNDYIGNASAGGQISAYVLADYSRSGIQLQTTEEPYGITVFANEEIPGHMHVKFAYYMFSLIPNSSFTAVQSSNGTRQIERESLAQMTSTDFNAIATESELLQKYYEGLAIVYNLPQIQTVRDDSYKLLFNAMQVAKAVPNTQEMTKPAYFIRYEKESYVVWLKEEAIYFLKSSEPEVLYEVTGKEKEKLQTFWASDKVVVEGFVTDKSSNTLVVEHEVNKQKYVITVDDDTKFEHGDYVTVWSTFVRETSPAISSATKIAKGYAEEW